MVEQKPFKLLVPGSNPGRPTSRRQRDILPLALDYSCVDKFNS